ncbi:MAG: AbrB/MazE/SpoVT family DNA-binding domain-containing protein [Actinobacteria bacterium]|nr:AbrB/MazE/SpoVT family DNA-binding domain-containing protein [Actinomycetota bacterium]
MGKTKVTRKGQVTIPKEIREQLSIKESDNLEVKVVGNSIVMERLGSFENLRGSVKIPNKYKNMKWKEIESIAQGEHAREVMNE